MWAPASMAGAVGGLCGQFDFVNTNELSPRSDTGGGSSGVAGATARNIFQAETLATDDDIDRHGYERVQSKTHKNEKIQRFVASWRESVSLEFVYNILVYITCRSYHIYIYIYN